MISCENDLFTLSNLTANIDKILIPEDLNPMGEMADPLSNTKQPSTTDPDVNANANTSDSAVSAEISSDRTPSLGEMDHTQTDTSPDLVGQARIYYMDAARSILMLLGVFLHTARIYDTESSWLISDNTSSFFFDAVGYVIHTFRMPAFFIISGFFCYMTLKKYPLTHFLKVRLSRIIVPLVSVAVLFNVTQIYVADYVAGSPRSWLEICLSRDYWGSRQWVAHLWFLNFLVIYFVVAAIAYQILCRFSFQANPLVKWLDQLMNLRGYFLLLPLADVVWKAFTRFAGLLDYYILGFIRLEQLVHYGLFFVLGFYFFNNRQALAKFSKAQWWMVLAIIISGMIHWWLATHYDAPWATAITIYLSTFVSLVASALVFHLFLTFFNQSSKLFYFLSDASYTTYLFHHLFVVCLGALLLTIDLSIYLKYTLIVILASAVAILLHQYLVLKIRPLRFLFNGK